MVRLFPAVLLILASHVRAQDRAVPVSPRAPLLTESARTGPHLGVAGALFTSWSKDPHVLRGPDGRITQSLVPQQLTTTALASLGLFDRLELTALTTAIIEDQGGAHVLGSASLAAKLHLIDVGPLAFGARTSLAVPATLSLDGAAVVPSLLASADFQVVRFAASAGARLRTRNTDAVWAVGAVVPVLENLDVVTDVLGDTSFDLVEHPIEGVAGARFHAGWFNVVAGLGGGLVAGVGTPRVRAFAGVSFALDPVPPTPAPAPPPMLAAPEPAPVAAPVAPVVTPPEPAPVEEPAPAVAIVDDEIRFDDKRVFFAVESDQLLPAGVAVLDAVAALLSAHPEIEHVVVEGHADALGDPEYNQRLSSWRASAVRRQLIKVGIEPARLSLRAKGTAKPVAPNATRDGRRQNRRVELHIVTLASLPGAAP